MALQELKTTINGTQVYARQWDATKALSNSAYLMSTCAELAIPFIEGNAEFDDVLRLLAGVEHTKLLQVLKVFVYAARISDTAGNPVELSDATVNQHFNGKLLDLILIFKAVCELQYKEFFRQGRELLPKM